ncbi:MAG: hypothetical protein LC808_28280 [Actinobacteria bacterium]|nr:hypothetical protein [Actinomycetota bacterium]
MGAKFLVLSRARSRWKGARADHLNVGIAPAALEGHRRLAHVSREYDLEHSGHVDLHGRRLMGYRCRGSRRH